MNRLHTNDINSKIIFWPKGINKNNVVSIGRYKIYETKMKKDKTYVFKITKKDSEMMKYLRNEHNVNISALLRKSIEKKYKELKND